MKSLRDLIAMKDYEFDSEGDHWLFNPNPDEAYLDVDGLVDAIRHFVRMGGEIG